MENRTVAVLIFVGLLLAALGAVSLFPLEAFARSFLRWAFVAIWVGMVVFLVGAFLGLYRCTTRRES